MPNLLTWFVGNLDPPITQIVTVDGDPVDLTGKSCRFKMRLLDSSLITVDQPVSNVPGSDGLLRYDWQAADVDTVGSYLVWWEVATAGEIQSVGEAFIQILAHAPVSRDYVELEEFKKTTNLDGLLEYDMDIKRVITAASRAIDDLTERRFYLDATSTNVRYFETDDPYKVWVDDIVAITSLKTDNDNDGGFETTWAGTDFLAYPLNAILDGQPWTSFRVAPSSGECFPAGTPRGVQLTGQFGWPAVPGQIKDATILVAHRLVKRERESPSGVLGFGMDGATVRVMANDPDVQALVQPFSRRVLVA